jgi:hypothetical protein
VNAESYLIRNKFDNLHKEEKDFQKKIEDASVDNQGSEFDYETPLGNFEYFESKLENVRPDQRQNSRRPKPPNFNEGPV